MNDQTDLAALLVEGLRIFDDGDGHQVEYRDDQWRCLDDCPAHVWLARVRGALAAGGRVTGEAGLREALNEASRELHRWHTTHRLDRIDFEDCASPYCEDARAALTEEPK